MIDYEALYQKETGIYHLTGDGNYRVSYVEWLKKRNASRDNLLSLSEARFRAGEEYLMAIELNKAYSEESNFMFCTERDKWQSIAAYDKAKGGVKCIRY